MSNLLLLTVVMATGLSLLSKFSNCYAGEKQVSLDFSSIMSPEVRSVPDNANSMN